MFNIQYIYGWYQNCNTYYWVGECSEFKSTTTTLVICGSPYDEYVGSLEQCTWVGDPVNYSNSSGSSGGYLMPAPTLQPQLKSLFKQGTTLEQHDVDKLNEAFDDMNLDCMLNSVTTFLTNNQIALGSVSINPNLFGKASIDAQGNLTFAGGWAITSKYLSHEWFHLGPKKMNNADLSNGYAEFECWLFFDIKETIRVQGNFGSSNHDFACYKNYYGDQPYKDEYQNWLMTITNNGTTFPTTNTMGFYNFGPKFAETRGYTFMPFSNTSYNPTTMFSLFNNCK